MRRNWNGLLPVPGDGRYEWDGFLPVLELPHVADPPRGWFATANQDNLPPGYPFAVGFQWTDPFRFSRIEEVLGSGRRFTLMDMMQLQQDELVAAGTLARAAAPRAASRPRTRRARPSSGSWPGTSFWTKTRCRPRSMSPGRKQLEGAVWELMVPREARSVLPASSLSTEKLIAWLTAPDGRFGADPIAGRDALLLKSLDQAVAELERRLGPT